MLANRSPYGLAFAWPRLRLAIAVADPPPPTIEVAGAWSHVDGRDLLLARTSEQPDGGERLALSVALAALGGGHEAEQRVTPAFDAQATLWLLPGGSPRLGLELTQAGLKPRLSTPFDASNVAPAIAAADEWLREQLARAGEAP